MQFVVEKGEGLLRRIKIEVPSTALTPKIEERIKKIAKTARINGFRPGKAPDKIVRSRYMAQIRDEIYDQFMRDTATAAMAKAELNPAALIVFDIHTNLDSNPDTLSYTVTFEILPTISEAALDSYTIYRPTAEITEEDVDSIIETLYHDLADWQYARRPAQVGDKVFFTINNSGATEPNKFPPEFYVIIGDSATNISQRGHELIGAKEGDTKTLEFLPHPSPDPQAPAPAPQEISITVTKILFTMSQKDANFAKKLGVSSGSLTELRVQVRRRMQFDLNDKISANIKSQVINILLKAHDFQLPKAMVEEEKRLIRSEQIQRNHIPDTSVNDALIESQAANNVKLHLIFRDIIKRNAIKLDKKRLQARIEHDASSYDDPDKFIAHCHDPKFKDELENAVFEEQIIDWIVSQTQVQTIPSTFHQIMKYR
ncbi:hypothetical protein TI04_02735 [Achromatium sp. WMS2]|nr:hypothetical protein TI04_02735 [Achromatium sp. WMS2]